MENLDTTRVELNHRQNDGIEVFLYWYRSRNVLSILLNDTKAQPPLHTEFLIPNDKGMHAFEHPFAYLPNERA